MYRSIYIFVDDALAHIQKVENCDGPAAWLQFIDLAADGQLDVWLDGRAIPIEHWKRSRRHHDIYSLTDAHRMEVRISDLQRLTAKHKQPAHGGRGPKKGELARYLASDRALCPKVTALMETKHLSCHEACFQLAEVGEVAGIGSSSSNSRAKRLASVYKAEKLKTR